MLVGNRHPVEKQMQVKRLTGLDEVFEQETPYIPEV